MGLMVGVTRCLFLCTALLLLPAIVASQPTECHIYDGQQPVREGWGAAYDVFSADHEVLLKATCTTNETQITVGNNNADTYIYHLAHYWINEQEEGDKQLQCNGEKVDNTWCVGEATAVISSQIKYFAAYTCRRQIDNSWKCGCRDTQCAESFWQLQEVGMQPHDACVFRHDNTIPVVNSEVGHVAWGWKIPGSNPERWVFGSTDSVERAAYIPPGDPNGFWTQEGSFVDMIDEFRRREYRELACRVTNTRMEQAARQEMERVRIAGYWVAGGNNCMNHTVRILNAYGARDMPDPNRITAWRPDDFFNQLGGPWRHGDL